MTFFDSTLYVSLFISLFTTTLVFIYITMYDKEKKHDRNTFCLKAFVLTFACTYPIMHLIYEKKDNPIDHIYTCEPDF